MTATAWAQEYGPLRPRGRPCQDDDIALHVLRHVRQFLHTFDPPEVRALEPAAEPPRNALQELADHGQTLPR